MPAVLLVRHGQASASGPDYDVLSERGHEQARRVGEELARRGLRDPLLVTGGLSRQRDTLASARERWDVVGEARVDPRWDEYDHLRVLQEHGDPGAWDGDPRHLQPVLDAAPGGVAGGGGAGGAGLARLPRPRPRRRRGRARRPAVGPRRRGGDQRGAWWPPSSRTCCTPPTPWLGLNRVAVNGAVTKVLVGRGGRTLATFNEHAHLEGPRPPPAHLPLSSPTAEETRVDLAPSPRAAELVAQARAFVDERVLPAEPEYAQWLAAHADGSHPDVPEVVERLEGGGAGRAGLWNLFLPDISGLSVVDYAHLAEVTGCVRRCWPRRP